MYCQVHTEQNVCSFLATYRILNLHKSYWMFLNWLMKINDHNEFFWNVLIYNLYHWIIKVGSHKYSVMCAPFVQLAQFQICAQGIEGNWILTNLNNLSQQNNPDISFWTLFILLMDQKVTCTPFVQLAQFWIFEKCIEYHKIHSVEQIITMGLSWDLFVTWLMNQDVWIHMEWRNIPELMLAAAPHFLTSRKLKVLNSYALSKA